MGNSDKKSSGTHPGAVVGKIISLPFKAVFVVGKFTINTLLKVAVNTQREYDNMDSKPAEEVMDIALGKKSSTTEQQTAARMYVKDMVDSYKKNH